MTQVNTTDAPDGTTDDPVATNQWGDPICEYHNERCLATSYRRLAAPFDHIFRDTRGNATFDYATGEQVKTRLLEVLGPGGRDFRVKEHGIHNEADEVWVLGELTVRIVEHDPNEPSDYIVRSVVVEQFGSDKIKRSRASGVPLDIGFQLKGAATDAEKKCAAEIGLGLYLWHKGGGIMTAPDDGVASDWGRVDTPNGTETPAQAPTTAPGRPRGPSPAPVGSGRKPTPASGPPAVVPRQATADEIAAFDLLAAEAKTLGYQATWLNDDPRRMTDRQIASYSRLLNAHIEKRQALAS